MWIANQWKDYEVIDYFRRGEAGTLGEIHSCAAGSPGYLGYAEDRITQAGRS